MGSQWETTQDYKSAMCHRKCALKIDNRHKHIRQQYYCSLTIRPQIALYIGFGGDGPTNSLSLDNPEKLPRILAIKKPTLCQATFPNMSSRITNSGFTSTKTDQKRTEKPWNSFYSFTETENFRDDFALITSVPAPRAFINSLFWECDFAVAKDVKFSTSPKLPFDEDVNIIGKMILVDCD